MATQYTNPYNLPWPQAGDPVKDGAAVMEALAKRVNQVLQDGSFPASTPVTADITARVYNLELMRRMEFKAGPTSIPGATQTLIGVLAKDTTGTNKNVGGDFATPGTTGLLTLSESGWYTVTALALPTGSPGDAWLKIIRVSDGSTIAQGGNNANMWEYTAHVVIPAYFAAGSQLKFLASSTVTHSINTVVTIRKHVGV